MGAVVAHVWVSGRLAVACAAMALALGGCGSSGETHSEELQLSDDEIEAQSARDLALELGISNPPKLNERGTQPQRRALFWYVNAWRRRGGLPR